MRPAIVIIGGGISGLTAGIALARRGLGPVIYE
jgi:2-polyprenyl-6-methoxyphenol hydroxylase-like FAD-dependent oxidoreductase